MGLAMIRNHIAAAILLAAAGSADATSLRPTVHVDTDLVTLGDLVDIAGKDAGVALFRAPALGQSGVISASRIVEAAARHGIDADASGVTTVTVWRNSRTVDQDDVEAAIRAELEAAGLLGPNVEADISISGLNRAIHLPSSITAPLEVVALNVGGDRFDATAVVPRPNGGAALAVRARGRLTEYVEVPILAAPVERFAIIGPDDITLERIEKKRARSAGLTAADVVGQAAARRLLAGAQLRHDDLRPPVLVRKNETATMLLKTGRLTLSAEARVLEDGAEGDLVEVLNTRSRRKVEGRVVAAGLVEVDLSPAAIAVANAPTASVSR